jgi:hypothetical protein
LENLRLKDVGANVFQPWEKGLADYLGVTGAVPVS